MVLKDLPNIQNSLSINTFLKILWIWRPKDRSPGMIPLFAVGFVEWLICGHYAGLPKVASKKLGKLLYILDYDVGRLEETGQGMAVLLNCQHAQVCCPERMQII